MNLGIKIRKIENISNDIFPPNLFYIKLFRFFLQLKNKMTSLKVKHNPVIYMDIYNVIADIF